VPDPHGQGHGNNVHSYDYGLVFHLLFDLSIKKRCKVTKKKRKLQIWGFRCIIPDYTLAIRGRIS